MTNVWIFTSRTDAAYDETQVNSDIKDGDVLIVPDQGVVGIMFKAWPTALTSENGHFHTFEYESDEARDSDIEDIHLNGIETAERYMSDYTGYNFVENGRSVQKTVKVMNHDALAQGGQFRVLSPISRDY